MRAWVTLAVFLLIVILVPFLLFEQGLNSLVDYLVVPHASRATVAGIIVALLALDVFLPVPSSIVSTAAGALLGFVSGLVVSTAGMTLGCVLAYGFSYRYGPPLVRRMMTERESQEVSAQFRRGAAWALAIMRPIPVLAEASALLAGVAGVPFTRYFIVTALANAGISAIYSAAGANALRSGSVLFALAGAVALPTCGMLIRVILRRSVRATPASPATSGSAGSR
jgi:uncharacterized membrane protein YdjX (TVP38/TMEM64 family)